MNHSRNTIARAVLAATLAIAATAAGAHGDARQPKAAGTVKKEQMPWGIAGDVKDARRTIEVAMGDDMRFTPSAIQVRQGETVRFVVRNRGRLLHEMVIGDRKSLEEHAALMLRFPTMEHDAPYMAHVAAGRKGALVWNFNRPGEFEFACLVPGHFQAGMTGRIQVLPAAATR